MPSRELTAKNTTAINPGGMCILIMRSIQNDAHVSNAMSTEKWRRRALSIRESKTMSVLSHGLQGIVAKSFAAEVEQAHGAKFFACSDSPGA
jgi:hypothetical protein